MPSCKVGLINMSVRLKIKMDDKAMNEIVIYITNRLQNYC